MIAVAFLSMVSCLLAGDAKVTVETPDTHVVGLAFNVRLVVEAPADGAKIEGWRLTPAGFTVDGKPLKEPGKEPAVELKAGEKKTVELDLANALGAALVSTTGEPRTAFKLGWGDQPAKEVHSLSTPADKPKFMDETSVPAADLAKYWVLMRTNRGDMLLELWPDVAPNHARNFLDLCSTGFYDGIIFHRCFPGFMIQAGNKATAEDVNAAVEVPGPRQLKAEFNSKKHVRGVLSMARTQDNPNSASSQFFVMQATNEGLDGKYTAFGRLISGYSVLDKIANAPGKPIPGAGGNRPTEPQRILRAVVVKAPADAAAWQETK